MFLILWKLYFNIDVLKKYHQGFFMSFPLFIAP